VAEGPASRLGPGGGPFSLPRILSCCHMEIYTAEDLTQLATKWGQPAKEWAGLPPCWAHLTGALSMGSTWSEVDRGDHGLTFC
jgi:hypothetical protein